MIAELRETRYTINEAAILLGVTRQAVQQWITHGSQGRVLRSIQIGSRYYIPESAIDEFVVVRGGNGPDA